MLPTLTEFPHVGSIAWLRPAADRPAAAKVRIQRDNGDGTRLISFDAPQSFRTPASGNTTVRLADLCPSRDAALAPRDCPDCSMKRARALTKPRTPRRSAR